MCIQSLEIKKSDLDEKMEKLGLKTGREKEVRTEINTRRESVVDGGWRDSKDNDSVIQSGG